MQAMQTETKAILHTELGVKSKEAIGFGILPIFENKVSQKADYTSSLKYATSWGSSSSYDYSFTFDYDFSTSTDPTIAGHPSDVIIGGGIDIMVGQATQGEINVNLFLYSNRCLI